MALKVESALKACVCSSGKKAMPVTCCSISYNTSSLVCIKGITATSVSVRIEQSESKQKVVVKTNKKVSRIVPTSVPIIKKNPCHMLSWKKL